MKKTNSLMHGLRKDEIWSCRFLLLVCFTVLLPIAIIARLSGWRWKPWPAGDAGYQSPIREAKAAAVTITGAAFSV